MLLAREVERVPHTPLLVRRRRALLLARVPARAGTSLGLGATATSRHDESPRRPGAGHQSSLGRCCRLIRAVASPQSTPFSSAVAGFSQHGATARAADFHDLQLRPPEPVEAKPRLSDHFREAHGS
jgi:hypothetical protein